jgi:hypothetical protein
MEKEATTHHQHNNSKQSTEEFNASTTTFEVSNQCQAALYRMVASHHDTKSIPFTIICDQDCSVFGKKGKERRQTRNTFDYICSIKKTDPAHFWNKAVSHGLKRSDYDTATEATTVTTTETNTSAKKPRTKRPSSKSPTPSKSPQPSKSPRPIKSPPPQSKSLRSPIATNANKVYNMINSDEIGKFVICAMHLNCFGGKSNLISSFLSRLPRGIRH